VLDAATGTIRYEVRGTGCGGALGYGLATLPQLNVFPRQEWLATAPGSVCNGFRSGRIYLFTTDTY
jgi:hypothetical protein